MLTAQGIHAFDDNYIWLIKQPKKPQVAIVDPGDAGPVIAAIEAQSLQPVAILITHFHADHTGGIADLLEQYPMPVYGPANESIPHMDHPLTESDSVEIPELGAQFQVLDVPGHTAGHISYYCENKGGQGMLFCGDTVFAGGCGRIFNGTAEQFHHSLGKIIDLPDGTLVYCAHEYTEDNLVFARIAEPDNQALKERQTTVQQQRQRDEATVPSLLGIEKATNPFLRFDQPTIIKAAETFAGHSLSNGAAVFATVRHWKDTLD
ncbi:MAG: hydroxyacylglutathione hydrolase [Gammaproteobacteria bacterium]